MISLRRIFFSDLTPLVEVGVERSLTVDDVPPLPLELQAEVKSLDEDKLNWSSGPLLLKSLLWNERRRIASAWARLILGILFQLMTPIFVNLFIASLADASATQWHKMSLGAAVGICGLASGLFIQHYFLRVLTNYQIWTNALNRKIFGQSLKLSQGERDKMGLGDIVNHMSSDSDSIANFGSVLGDVLNTVLTLLGFVVLSFYYLGWTAVSGFLTLLTVAPLVRWIGGQFKVLDEDLMKKRDLRVTLMSQVLSAIRLVKYFAWEKSVALEVQKIRHQELRIRKKYSQAELASSMIFMSVGTLVLFVVLGVHVWRGHVLTVALVFTIMSLFRVIEDPMSMISRLVASVANARVAAQRLADFANKKSVNIQQIQAPSKIENSIELENFNLKFGDSKKLSDINFVVKRGEKIALVGPVGGGKSLLLQSILGEFEGEGRIARRDLGVGWVPQEAYIMNATILDNLLMGQTRVSFERMNEILWSCALDEDLTKMPAGLMTEIGERGVNLSGGQKQRMSLARAAVHDSDTILLDDPFSAVDPHTEDLLVERLLQEIWAQKTIVLATHRLSHLDQFDRVYFIDDGRILGQGNLKSRDGTPSEGLGSQFVEFYASHSKVMTKTAPIDKKTQLERGLDQHKKIENSESAESSEASRITQDEDRAFGAVKASIYWEFILSLCGQPPKMWRLIILIGATVLGVSLPLVQKAWIGWVSEEQATGWLAPGPGVLIYGLLGLVVLFVSLQSDLYWLKRGILAGRALHDKMLKSVLHARVRFFDSTPVGRVIQRFSRDVEAVDFELQWTFEHSIRALLQVIANLVIIIGALPISLFVITPVAWIYYSIQKKYRSSARELKRMDSISRSPRYAHFKETLGGLVVLRAMGKSDWYFQEFGRILTFHQKMFRGHYMVNRWFSSRVPLIGAAVAIGTTCCISLAHESKMISLSTAGLVTISSLGFWGLLNWGIRIWADVEAKMTSVERIRSFSVLESESEFEKIEPQESWPQLGRVEFKNVSLRYASHLPKILNDLSFEIIEGTRVGLIGRTGSGKSTVLQALFRFNEIESGQILIDHVDIASVPLVRLRRSIAMIPQDPSLFMGTLRSNLDRFSDFTDLQLWESLDQVKLGDFFRAAEGLQFKLLESGSNLSQGQRQLLCLARALLVGAKIIVLDEATASVDVKTDENIQEILRTSCRGRTVITIAHRLGTVKESHQILELASGQLKRKIVPVSAGLIKKSAMTSDVDLIDKNNHSQS